jgi:hypothetical protein
MSILGSRSRGYEDVLHLGAPGYMREPLREDAGFTLYRGRPTTPIDSPTPQVPQSQESTTES